MAWFSSHSNESLFVAQSQDGGAAASKHQLNQSNPELSPLENLLCAADHCAAASDKSQEGRGKVLSRLPSCSCQPLDQNMSSARRFW